MSLTSWPRMRFGRFGPWAVMLALGFALSANGQRIEFVDTEGGISCSYFDVRLGLKWRTGKPEWTDADGRPNGERAFASVALKSGDTQRAVRLDVSALVREVWSGKRANHGFLLKLDGGQVVEFGSREVQEMHLRPQLLLVFADGRRRYLEPTSDATLDCSTYKGQGHLPHLRFVRDNTLALRFDLDPKGSDGDLESATLVLVRARSTPMGAATISAFALEPPYGRDLSVRADGLARQFRNDAGIANHPDVVFADGFDGGSASRQWKAGQTVKATVVNADPVNGFEPLAGPAFRVIIPKRELLGLDYRYRFRDHLAEEPEEIYFRYYLRLAPSWLGAADAGKLPGLAGTYDRAGWGGRGWDGNAGWSLRGAYGLGLGEGTHAPGHLMLSTYAYHAGSKGHYGEGFVWADGDLAGLITPNRWVCIEQHLKLNTPGQHDGLFEVWVDGKRALRREDLRLRDRSDIRIEDVWMNFYHGGTTPAPLDMHAYIDQVVVARRYIGPLQR